MKRSVRMISLFLVLALLVAPAAILSETASAATLLTHAAQEEALTNLTQELDALRAQLASDKALLEALDRYAQQLQAGQRGPARAHIQHAHHPASDHGGAELLAPGRCSDDEDEGEEGRVGPVRSK